MRFFKKITNDRHEMAWNEPGGSGSGSGGDKDPWGSRSKDQQGPPDLDEVVRKLQEKFNSLFGGGGKSNGSDSGGGGGGIGAKGIGTLAVIGVVLWGLSGLYIVDEGSRGVVLRFGAYEETVMSGLHWHIPYPIEQVKVVNVQEIRNAEVGYRSNLSGQGSRDVPREALMLTQDENIIDIKFAIQYRIKDARDYLFNVNNPDITLHQATESAVREIIGKSTMDFVLTEGRTEIVVRAKALIQSIVDKYDSGLQITSVNMQDAQPPEQVQAAFSDAVKAREDEVRLKNEAEAYSNDILPKARGTAARMMEEANAYQAKVIAEAEGDASRFTQVLAEYKLAPRVTRQRLYMDAIENVMSKSTKVIVDVDGGNNMLYIPLDKMMQQAAIMPLVNEGMTAPARSGALGGNNNQRTRSSLRNREVR